MQLIVTYIILGIVALIIGSRIVKMFLGKKDKGKDMYCSGCPMSCSKKELIKHKKSCH